MLSEGSEVNKPKRGGGGASCPVDMLSNLNKEDYFCTYVINLYS